MTVAVWLGVATLVSLAVLRAWRYRDRQKELAVWDSLMAQVKAAPGVFRPDLVAGLPEPARRYFEYSIQPGTVLGIVVELEMTGELGLLPVVRAGGNQDHQRSAFGRVVAESVTNELRL